MLRRALPPVALLLFQAAVAEAQVGADSLARTAPGDSVRPPAIPAPGDTARADTVRVGADTAMPRPPTSQAPSPAAVAIPGPVDTTLARACRGLGPGTLAPGLLAAVFRPGTTEKARADAARAVGGTVGGLTDMGEVYVRVPPEAGPLPVVADRLIRQDPVTRVTPIPCPPPAAPAAPAQQAPGPPAQAPPPQAPPAQAPPAQGAAPPRDTSAANARDSTAAAPTPPAP
jgi:hypothetical protein